MGATQSSSDSDDCQPCFFFKAPLAKKRSGERTAQDLMGSPLPPTPVHRRKQFQDAMDRDNQQNGVYSSKYFGLEKEVSGGGRGVDGSRSLAAVSTGGQAAAPQHPPQAEVHEGPDAEAELNQKYQMLEVLGVGSTSTCHRCVLRSTGKNYACKIIDKALIEERFQGMMEQFHTEIDALRELRHPNIIQLLDVYVSEEKIFIIMELMEGGELFDYVVQKGTLTEDEAAKIVRSVTDALVYMHSKNIMHRDLKPENLLLRAVPKSANDNIEVKIIDFGLSKAVEEDLARSFLGTRGYLAPEMLQRRDYTRAVDTWALGVIVFVLLCGCLPFDDDSQTVPSDDLVRQKFVLRFPRWAKNLSASAKDLLSHLLDVNPATRYTAEQALSHPWVRGDTAPKNNMLASPGRIKKSPVLRPRATPNQSSSVRRNDGRYHPPSRNQRGGVAYTPPSRGIVRKQSI